MILLARSLNPINWRMIHSALLLVFIQIWVDLLVNGETTQNPFVNEKCPEACDQRHGECKTRRDFEEQLAMHLMPKARKEVKAGNITVYKDRRICSCHPGYYGAACSKRCKVGHGPYCSEPCPQNCAGGCDPQTGECEGRCKTGFDGDHCAIQIEAEPPIVEIFPEQQTVVAGQPVDFFCKATGSPKPDLKWSKIGQQQPSSSPSRFRNGVFTIQRVDDVDSGTYLCRAQNIVGISEATADLYVVEKENKTETPSAHIKDCPDVNDGRVQCENNDREISAFFDLSFDSNFYDDDEPDLTERQKAIARLRNESLELQVLITELNNNVWQTVRRTDWILIVGGSFLCVACLCVAILVVPQLWSNRMRMIRQIDNEIRMKITSTFPSSKTQGLNVRSVYKKFLEEFSENFKSKVLPGAKIRKDSILVREVKVINGASSSPNTSEIYMYLLYGGVILIGLLMVSIVILYALRKKSHRQKTHDRFRKSGGIPNAGGIHRTSGGQNFTDSR